MFELEKKKINLKYQAVVILVLMLISLMSVKAGVGQILPGNTAERPLDSFVNSSSKEPLNPEQDLIRFHVLANSDREEDQTLKLAVRDRILNELSPRLAQSKSLADSRRLLNELRPEMERLAAAVVKERGFEYGVHTEYGRFPFPTKSYGSFVLPAGEYEALRVVIGQGQGANWWCVLFPPICFVDIEHSTAVPVDGKQGVPIKRDQPGIKLKPVQEQDLFQGQAQEQKQNEDSGIDQNKALNDPIQSVTQSQSDMAHGEIKPQFSEGIQSQIGKSQVEITPQLYGLQTKNRPVFKLWIWEKAKEILGRYA